MDIFWEIAGCVFVSALGVLMLAKADFVWKIDHFFTVKDGEPAELYLTVVRLAGFGLIWLGIICAVIFIFFSP